MKNNKMNLQEKVLPEPPANILSWVYFNPIYYFSKNAYFATKSTKIKIESCLYGERSIIKL